MTMADGANLDIYLVDPDLNFAVAAYAYGDSNPEVMSVSYSERNMLPGETWYLVVYGWTGDASDHDYQIDIEWLEP